MDSQRKISDIILELEAKINSILSILVNQDLLLKNISNRLKASSELNEINKTISKPSIEAVNILPAETHLINAAADLQKEDESLGFRRNSRPETYSDPPKKEKSKTSKSDNPPEIIVQKKQKQVDEEEFKEYNQESLLRDPNSSTPVIQRVIDANGKSVFLADVEIVDLNSKKQIYKTRTNGTGKWTASLPTGKYHIIVKKRASNTKEKIEMIQELSIDGKQSRQELDAMVIK
jgi:hypothetical protein